MKILIVTSKFPRYKNDPQPGFVYYLAKELIKKGHNIYVSAPHDYKAKEFEISEGAEIHRIKYFIPAKMQRLFYGSGLPANIGTSILPFIQLPIFSLLQYIKVKNLIKKIRPDIIHVHWGFPQGLPVMNSKKPYIVTIYGGEVFMTKKFHLIWILDKIMENSYKTFTLTSGLTKVMREYGFRSKLQSIPLGFDKEVFNPNIKDYKKIRAKYCKNNELMILSVARLVEKKGLEYLIRAFHKVNKKRKDVKLVIVGSGILRNKLEQLVKDLKLNDNVFLVGEITHDVLPKYYKASDIFVLPSIIDSQGDRETQGVVYVEAMATKIPVIGTNTGGIPDVISSKNLGILVEQKNPDQLTEAILKLLNDKDLREYYADNAYNHVMKNFTWESIANKYIKVYNEILNYKKERK